MNMNPGLALLISIFVALPLAGGVIWFVCWLMQKFLGVEKGAPWLFFWLGMVERAIFFYSAYHKEPAVIAGWFALKGLASFKEGGKDVKNFYGFLIGSGLSLICGVGGAMLFQWLVGKTGGCPCTP